MGAILKRFLAVFASAGLISLSLSNPLVANGAVWLPDFDDVYSDGRPYVSFALSERGSEQGAYSEIFLFETISQTANSSTSSVWTTCIEFGEYPCDPQTILRTKSEVVGFLLMPSCQSATSDNCIESLRVYKLGEDPVAASYLGEAPGTSIKANSAAGIPRSGMPSLFSAGGVNHEGGVDTYAVQFLQEITIKNGRLSFDFVSVAVMPYTEVSDSNAKPVNMVSATDKKGRKIFRGEANIRGNAWVGSGVRGELENFAPDTRVSVTIRAPKAHAGWFKGRISKPDISISSFNAKTNRITVDASVVEVPRIAAVVDINGWTPELAKIFPDGKQRMLSGESTGVGSSVEDNASWVKALTRAAGDRAAGITTVWNYSTLPSWARGNSPCLSDSSRVIGIVSTNAAVYDGKAPLFQNGFLNYQVSGMHYLPDGFTKARGTYDLVMRSDVARCLYGFPRTPLSATVQVVNDRGSKTFATSVVGEKDGWLKLGAYNFTFSNKTIKVKITKAKAKKAKR